MSSPALIEGIGRRTMLEGVVAGLKTQVCRKPYCIDVRVSVCVLTDCMVFSSGLWKKATLLQHGIVTTAPLPE